MSPYPGKLMASTNAPFHIRWLTNDNEHDQLTSDLQTRLQEILGAAYHIDRELGGAGMSRVFVATDSELDRQVVLQFTRRSEGPGRSGKSFPSTGWVHDLQI